MLNNELTDFALKPERDDGLKVVNRVEPGKRPRSSMAPMLVFGPDEALFAAVGSPGGSRIIGYVAQTLVALIDWRMTMQQAVACHILNIWRDRAGRDTGGTVGAGARGNGPSGRYHRAGERTPGHTDRRQEDGWRGRSAPGGRSDDQRAVSR